MHGILGLNTTDGQQPVAFFTGPCYLGQILTLARVMFGEAPDTTGREREEEEDHRREKLVPRKPNQGRPPCSCPARWARDSMSLVSPAASPGLPVRYVQLQVQLVN
jgi:hypothetical protein